MSKHDEVANKLAKKFKTEYKSDKGIDLVLPTKVIEVETQKAGILQGIKQVEKSQKARYLAVNKIKGLFLTFCNHKFMAIDFLFIFDYTSIVDDFKNVVNTYKN